MCTYNMGFIHRLIIVPNPSIVVNHLLAYLPTETWEAGIVSPLPGVFRGVPSICKTVDEKDGFYGRCNRMDESRDGLCLAVDAGAGVMSIGFRSGRLQWGRGQNP